MRVLTVDGKTVRLDLTAANSARVEAAVGEFLAAGGPCDRATPRGVPAGAALLTVSVQRRSATRQPRTAMRSVIAGGCLPRSSRPTKLAMGPGPTRSGTAAAADAAGVANQGVAARGRGGIGRGLRLLRSADGRRVGRGQRGRALPVHGLPEGVLLPLPVISARCPSATTASDAACMWAI